MVCAHVNHMIRENAILDQEYVEKTCYNLGIKCFVKQANVLEIAKQEKISTEEAGRNVRYSFFDEVLKETKADKIAIAHNANDNAETVILNILRGSGISGLKGIEPVRENKYIRPLIEVTRGEIEEYCKENNLNPRHDESNDESIYTRNKVRNDFLPYIEKEFNPNIISTINRLSDLAYEEYKYFDDVVGNEFDRICVGAFYERPPENNINYTDNHRLPLQGLDNTIILNLKEFNKLHLVIKRRLVLYTINRLLGNTKGIEKIHIDDVIKMCSNNVGNKFLTPRKHLKISLNRGKIIFENCNKKEI